MLKLLNKLETEFGFILFLKGYKKNTYLDTPKLKLKTSKRTGLFLCYNETKYISISDWYTEVVMYSFYRSNFVLTSSEIDDIESIPKFRPFSDIALGVRSQEDFKEIYESMPDFEDPYEDLIIVAIAKIDKIDSLISSLNNNTIKSNKELIISCNILDTFGYLHKVISGIRKKYNLKYLSKIKKI